VEEGRGFGARRLGEGLDVAAAAIASLAARKKNAPARFPSRPVP